MSGLHPLFGAALALAPLSVTIAQETPAPIVPPIDYSLPAGSNSQQTAPVVPPVVVPTATPTPRPTPTTSATPRPRPTASPTPRATPTPRPTPAPTPTPSEAAPTPSAAQPAPEPDVADQPLPPAPVATPTPLPEAPAAAAAPVESGGWGGWLLAGVAILLVAAVLLWRRRRVGGAVAIEPVEVPAPRPTPPAAMPEATTPRPTPPAPQPGAPRPPVPVSPPAPTPPAAPTAPAADEPQFLSRPAGPPLRPSPPIPAGTITAFSNKPKPADAGFVTAFRRPAPVLGIELQPVRAGIADDETAFVEFQFAMVNASDQTVSDMMVSAWLVSASPDQDAQIAAYLNEKLDPAQHNRYVLKSGEHREHRATMGAPVSDFHIVEAAGRRFFAPILLVDARYRGQGGAEGRSSAAFMIGRPNATTGKLTPIYVDRGPRVIEGLTARPYPLRGAQGE